MVGDWGLGTGDWGDEGDEGDEGAEGAEEAGVQGRIAITHYSLLITHYPLPITHYLTTNDKGQITNYANPPLAPGYN
ncbi:hypothetical protein FDUTEX481_08010 [Tolypothrix sp. PCC 7601]|nr:hypothetical protein FDUTEX481_08010 [Tolypothrix sp. PCC 7601]